MISLVGKISSRSSGHPPTDRTTRTLTCRDSGNVKKSVGACFDEHSAQIKEAIVHQDLGDKLHWNLVSGFG
jgi:hypothetical protein